jgi:cytidine deaminase
MHSDLDLELIAAARSIIRARYKPDWHAVGCAMRTRTGKVHLGVHLECYVGRMTVCAEAIAIGQAVTSGDDLAGATIVAVHQASPDAEPTVVSPCGMCREMISDYAPDARVIVPRPDGFTVMGITHLLPEKYSRSEP